jgi:cytochrome o ubiquinol oxidase operon protein cyoD
MANQQLHHEPGSGTGEGNFFSYSLGYIFALLLTLFAFGCVLLHRVTTHWIFPAIVIAAIAQIYVHLSFFLHMGRHSTPRWNIIVFAFAMIVIAILIGGSIWIMASANHQMMPANDVMQMP